jgi:hypothetical protein
MAEGFMYLRMKNMASDDKKMPGVIYGENFIKHVKSGGLA